MAFLTTYLAWLFPAWRRLSQGVGRVASSKTMLGDLPPSSNPTGVIWLAASCAMTLPVSAPPVKTILLTPGWRTKAPPAVCPRPVTTLNTPGGNPASYTSLANSNVEAEVCSEGFTTTVLPAANAAAKLKLRMSNGEFQGVMMPTTPTGSRRV
jgi:hypothetical protein